MQVLKLQDQPLNAFYFWDRAQIAQHEFLPALPDSGSRRAWISSDIVDDLFVCLPEISVRNEAVQDATTDADHKVDHLWWFYMVSSKDLAAEALFFAGCSALVHVAVWTKQIKIMKHLDDRDSGSIDLIPDRNGPSCQVVAGNHIGLLLY